MQRHNRILVLGIGNTLLSDDGFGVHVINRLSSDDALSPDVLVRDGGTLGLSLLPDIEDSDGLIVVDAGELSAQPGELRVFRGAEVEDHLSRCKGTVHEVAMADLLDAAKITGRAPSECALVVVQPEQTGWGDYPTDRVAAAIPLACDVVRNVIADWRQ